MVIVGIFFVQLNCCTTIDQNTVAPTNLDNYPVDTRLKPYKISYYPGELNIRWNIKFEDNSSRRLPAGLGDAFLAEQRLNLAQADSLRQIEGAFGGPLPEGVETPNHPEHNKWRRALGGFIE